MKPMLELKHLCFEAETDAGVRQILKAQTEKQAESVLACLL